jgi:hypothetical protein
VASAGLDRSVNAVETSAGRLRGRPARADFVNLDIPGFAQAAFSMEVLADVPILAERAVYWGEGTPETWRDAHNPPGATSEHLACGLAEGPDGVFDESGTPYRRTS